MKEIENFFLEIDPKKPESQQQIADFREHLDEACATAKITVREWRVLLDRVAALKAQNPFR